MTNGTRCRVRSSSRRLGVGATARASLYLYNDEADVDALADGLEETAKFFG